MKTNIKKLTGIVAIIAILAAPVLAGEYRLLRPAELKNMLKNKDFFLLDVHVPELSHIPGTDAFIDYRKIRQNSRQLPSEKNTRIVVYCLGGGMSFTAARELVEMGYTHVYDLAGGTLAYHRLPD
ncbi:MAG: rhodanese-like domain-containing protein [Desulfobacterales bacterium]|nr:rhodanese-like domain-containing protein [Desulfobacterales bacterium]